MTPTPELPGWIRPMSRAIIRLQELGIAFLSFHVLSIPGRRSGQIRRTVVSPFTVEGSRYVLSFGELDWVRNARAAGWGILARGRQKTRVALVEVSPPDSRPIVREFPRLIPGGVRFFVGAGLVEGPGREEQFAAAAERLVLFRISEAADAGRTSGPPAAPS